MSEINYDVTRGSKGRGPWGTPWDGEDLGCRRRDAFHRCGLTVTNGRSAAASLCC